MSPPEPSFSVPDANSPTSTEEPKIITALQAIKDLLTGGLDEDNLDVTIPATNTSSEDTQTANITATGVLTGISITPGAGTYLAIASASFTATGTNSVTLALRVAGSNVVSGFTVGLTSGLQVPLIVHGAITPTAGQAVQVYGTIVGTTATIASGRLTLVKLA